METVSTETGLSAKAEDFVKILEKVLNKDPIRTTALRARIINETLGLSIRKEGRSMIFTMRWKCTLRVLAFNELFLP